MEAELSTSGDYGFCASGNQEQRRCARNFRAGCNLGARERTIVCVTSGNSLLSSHIIKQLLARGYLVRATLQYHVDFENMKETMSEEEMNQLESVVVAKMEDVDALSEAFRGCHVIFHTSSFIDPRGVSGYSERMAFLETEAAKNVVEACARTAYVKRCIFTSSLLASVWKGNDDSGSSKAMDETCWSNEEFCIENKLWLALGKIRAEKTAWRKAKELKVKLVTICPGLLMPPMIPNSPPASVIPYLKGSKTLLQQGLLAVDDFEKLAKAHVSIYEEMDHGACGRYFSFERVISGSDEASQIEQQLNLHELVLSGSIEEQNEIESSLTNARLTKLIARASNRMASCR